MGHTLLMCFPAIVNNREARRGRIIVGWSANKDGADYLINSSPTGSRCPHSQADSLIPIFEPGLPAGPASRTVRPSLDRGIGCTRQAAEELFHFSHQGVSARARSTGSPYSNKPADRNPGAFAWCPVEGRSVSSSSRAATSEAL